MIFFNMLKALLLAIANFGRGLVEKTLALVLFFGRSFWFLLGIIGQLPRALPGDVSRQLFNVGVLSLPIILLAGAAVGMVLALQGYYTLVNFNAEQSLGVLVALSLLRELGPVVTALLFAGRAGSAISAEIGLMKSSEQLAAMQVMGVSVTAFVLVPRFWAMLLALPLLVVLFNTLAIFGGYWIAVVLLGVDDGSFWGLMQQNVDFNEDFLESLGKSVIFAVLIAWVSLWQGMKANPTPEGVSLATTQSVVYGSLLVLLTDFLLTALLFRAA